MKSKDKFYNIHALINANTLIRPNGEKWIVWASKERKQGRLLRRINKAAEFQTSESYQK